MSGMVNEVIELLRRFPQNAVVMNAKNLIVWTPDMGVDGRDMWPLTWPDDQMPDWTKATAKPR